MPMESAELDRLQENYKAAAEKWIAAMRYEEELASVTHTLAEVDSWEAAAFEEDKARIRAKSAKLLYEDALREKFFNF